MHQFDKPFTVLLICGELQLGSAILSSLLRSISIRQRPAGDRHAMDMNTKDQTERMEVSFVRSH